MATYNGERYLKSQLDTIVPFMMEDDELIISDDGSTDATKTIVDTYIKSYPNVKWIEGPKKGVVKNFENALMNSKKNIIMFADQDDIWMPDKLCKIRDLFIKNGDVELILHDMYMCSNDQILNHKYGMSDFSVRKRRHGVLYNVLYSGYYGCCMCFREELKSVILPFSEKVNMYDQWIGLIGESRKKVMFLDEPLIVHRVHDNNMTRKLSFIQSLKAKFWVAMAYTDYLTSKRK
jgi:glycosyltransferase involved in cell wall biosynthesis